MRFSLNLLVSTLIHAALPLACVLMFGAPVLWVLSGVLFAFGLSVGITRPTPPWARGVLVALSMLVMLGSQFFASSWYMQGGGFNDAFMYHLDGPTFSVAFASFPVQMGIAVILLLASIFWPLFARPDWSRPVSAPRFPVWLVPTAVGLALLTWSPVHSYLGYRLQAQADDTVVPGVVQEVGESPRVERPTGIDRIVPVGTHKNILLIYAESLEQLYFDTGIFGDLFPRLTALGTNAQRFTNLRQLRGTGWTIAGIVASQCGFPLISGHHTTSNSTIASAERPFPDSTCLADVLAANDYETVYLGGADLAFGGKGNFLRAHGYGTVLGRDELEPRLPEGAELTGWGLYDDQLLGFAREELLRLEAGDAPWLLTVLTLDTHHPTGEPSESCTPVPDNDDRMIDALNCSDQLLGEFLDFALETVDLEETIIVLFSDHLAIRTSLSAIVDDHHEDRRLTLMLFDGRPGSVSAVPGSHFDIAPTILDAAGVADDVAIGQGQSLFSGDTASRTRHAERRDFAPPPRVLDSGASALDTGFVITAEPLAIQAGDLDLVASENGRPFSVGMFLAILAEDGTVRDTLYTDDFGQLLRDFPGRPVIGVSMFEGAPGPTWFAGRISNNPATIVNQPLLGEARMSGAELRELLARGTGSTTSE